MQRGGKGTQRGAGGADANGDHIKWPKEWSFSFFPSGCEGKLGVALESLQGLRDLT